MAKPYPLDLRGRVGGALLSGLSHREVALTFGVSVASAVKWAQRLRQSGGAAAKPTGGGSVPVFCPPRRHGFWRGWKLVRI